MQNPKVTQHRLGIAKKALQRILDYKGDEWCADWEYIAGLRTIAEEALKEMNTEVDKSRKRFEEEQRTYIQRVAEQVKAEVPK